MSIPQNKPSSNFGTHKGGKRMNKLKLYGGSLGVALLFLGILAYNLIGFVEVKGHQAAIIENQFSLFGLVGDKGVQEAPLGPGKHFIIPFAQNYQVYNVGTDNFVMGADKYYSGKGTDFTDFGALEITCSGGKNQEQPAFFSFTLQYNIKKNNLHLLHVESGKQYKDRIIKPAIVRIINDLATPQNVLNFYSGAGKTKLQNEIFLAIKNDSTITGNGINVTTFVFDNISLNEKYEKDIVGAQLAVQEKKRVDAEKLVEIAKAEKQRETAQAEKFERVAKAEGENLERQEAAKAKAFEVTEAAKAAAESVKAAATADAFKKTANAIALRKEGLAKAAVQKALKVSKYAGEAGRRQAAVDLMSAKVEMFSNFRSKIITEKTFLTITNGLSNNNSPIVTIDANK